MSNLSVIIVEDEANAAKHLTYLLQENAPEVKILVRLQSIEQTVKWLAENPPPSLGFFDIQLEDGLSFDIFKQIPVDFPVIFTTAFNEYAIEAFKVNSVDYLLKPIKAEDLRFSLDKFRRINNRTKIDSATVNTILTEMSRASSTLLISYRDKIIPIPVSDFAFFYIQHNQVYGCTHKNQRHHLDFTFEELEQKVHPSKFFRANRQYIINRAAILEISLYFNGRLLLQLTPPTTDSVLVSKAKAPAFKQWLESGH